MHLRALIILLAIFLPGSLFAQTIQREMDYADVFRNVSLRSAELSPDGEWLVYESSRLSFPGWRQRSNLFLASADGQTTRQLTFGENADDRAPSWHPSEPRIAFTSTRASGRQLFLMRPDGGEAKQLTRGSNSVGSWQWLRNGSGIVYLGGPAEDRQIWWVPGNGVGEGAQFTSHPTPVSAFYLSDDSATIYYLAADEDDAARRKRMEEGFDVQIADEAGAAVHLWAYDIHSGESRRLTSGDFRVSAVELASDGRWAAFRAVPTDRFEDSRANELYLLEIAAGSLEQLTDNFVSEGRLAFSPDSRLLAASAPRDFRYGMISQILVRPVEGGEWQVVTPDFDRHASVGIWSDDSRTIYTTVADGVNTHVYAVDAAGGGVRQVTDVEGVITLSRHDPTGELLIRFSDPYSPTDLYRTSPAQLARQDRWTRLTDLNPWTQELRLGQYDTVRWTSTDGTEVEGVLVYPLDYDESRSYPLVVQIHGGPASAYQNRWGGGYGTYPHIFAARGYAVLQPNYRGSTGYGEHFQSQIAGDYWPRAYEDLITGVDHLIERGIAHPDSLGMMGWSAGGHWSNWTLVSTDRFKAISTGAGVTNWISLYGQTDVQTTREYYLGGDAERDTPNQPWDDFEHWWAESPLKYIHNARTPTLIHFGEQDERIPMPQGQELHMALKKLGVPTEFIVYPGQPHGIQNARYQLVKMASELDWFEHWIRGTESWLDWSELLAEAERIEEAAGG